MIYPPYFLQSKAWANFWKKANGSGHDAFFLSSESKPEISSWVYQYPWQLNQNFWYIPRFPFSKSKSYHPKDVQEFFKKLIAKAKTENVTFIKLDFDDEFCQQLELNENADLKKLLKQMNLAAAVRISRKSIQFLQTSTLDLDSCLRGEAVYLAKKAVHIGLNENIPVSSVKEIYDATTEFWNTTNQKIRRYTKKSFNYPWQISVDKSEQNFQAFIQVYALTKDRQDFAIQTTEYLRELFFTDQTRIIVLKSETGQPECVWFGYVSSDTITYLYGGNTSFSFQNQGQYLSHVVACTLAVAEGLRFYDLGGYNPKLGFGQFKEGYRGTIRTFLGPIDLVVKPWRYLFTNFIITAGKTLLGKKL